MSDYESHYGKLIKIKENISKEEMLEFANNLVTEELPDYCEDVFEYIKDEQDKYPYYFSNENIYELKNKYIGSDDDIFDYTKIDKNTTEYQFRFYNGGTCLEEYVQELIEILEDE